MVDLKVPPPLVVIYSLGSLVELSLLRMHLGELCVGVEVDQGERESLALRSEYVQVLMVVPVDEVHLDLPEAGGGQQQVLAISIASSTLS